MTLQQMHSTPVKYNFAFTEHASDTKDTLSHMHVTMLVNKLSNDLVCIPHINSVWKTKNVYCRQSLHGMYLFPR